MILKQVSLEASAVELSAAICRSVIQHLCKVMSVRAVSLLPYASIDVQSYGVGDAMMLSSIDETGLLVTPGDTHCYTTTTLDLGHSVSYNLSRCIHLLLPLRIVGSTSLLPAVAAASRATSSKSSATVSIPSDRGLRRTESVLIYPTLLVSMD